MISVWNKLGYKISSDTTVLAREDILFCKCFDCRRPLAWRHKHNIVGFVATCCASVYDATPKDFYLRMFEIRKNPLNMKNVIQLTTVDNGK